MKTQSIRRSTQISLVERNACTRESVLRNPVAEVSCQVYCVSSIENANPVWTVEEVCDKVVADDGQKVAVENGRVVYAIRCFEVVLHKLIVRVFYVVSSFLQEFGC